MNKILLLVVILFSLSFTVEALTSTPSLFYAGATNYESLTYLQNLTGTDMVLARESNTHKTYYMINASTGVLFDAKTFYNGANYGLKQYGNYFYISRYGGSVGSSVNERYNLTYTNATTINSIGYLTNTGGDRFGAYVGKYYYWLTGISSNYLRVWDITNGTVIRQDAYTFSFDKSDTQCDGKTIEPLGYDYDNDYLYFTCTGGDLVYIKDDFYLTSMLYNNVELDEALIDNLTNPATNLDSTAQFKFIITNNNLYLINVSNTSQILSSTYTNEYADLDCHLDVNTNQTICLNPYRFCMHPAFTSTLESKSMCLNTTFTDTINAYNINPDYDTPIYMYCNDDVTYCNLGCTNTLFSNNYNVSYYQAVCNIDNSCTNECYILGERKDLTLNTYSNCTTNNNDNCLHLETITCATGEVAYGGVCINLDGNFTTISKLSFGINPYTGLLLLDYTGNATTTNADLHSVDYYPQETPPRLQVKTRSPSGSNGVFPLSLKVLYPDNTYYTSFVCDYESTINNYQLTNTSTVKNELVELITNKELIINGDTSNKETLTFLNNETTIFSINVTDITDKLITNLFFIVNNTNGEIIIYNNTVGGDILSVYTYDVSLSLDNVKIELFQLHANTLKKQNALISIYSGSTLLKTQGFSMLNYLDTNAYNSYKIGINSISGNLYLKGLVYETIKSGYNGVYELEDITTNYLYTGCIYTNDECYNMRVFLMETYASQFFSYQDLKICKDTIPNSQSLPSETDGTTIFGKLTTSQKLIYGFILSGLIVMFFVILGVMQNDEREQKVLTWIGVFGFIGGLIVFAILGWIPVWILIVCGIVASMGIGLFFISKMNGA